MPAHEAVTAPERTAGCLQRGAPVDALAVGRFHLDKILVQKFGIIPGGDEDVQLGRGRAGNLDRYDTAGGDPAGRGVLHMPIISERIRSSHQAWEYSCRWQQAL